MDAGVGTRAGHSPLLVAGALATVYVVWGSTYLFIRYAAAAYPPLFFPGFRYAVSGLLMTGWLLLRGHPQPSLRQLRNAALVGMLLLNGGNGFVVFAERKVGSALAAVVFATVPLWTGLFAWLLGHRATRLQWLGTVIGFAGVLLLNLSGDFAAAPSAALELLCGALTWSLGTVLAPRLELPKGAMSSAMQMLLAGVFFLAGSAALGEHWLLAAPPRAMFAVVYLILFGSLLAFTAYVYLTRAVSPTIVTSYAYVNPVIAVLLGVYLGGEHFGALDVAAMLLVLASVVLIILARRRPAA